MYLSAEIRLWWRGNAPAEAVRWFDAAPFPPGGGKTRTDIYLLEPEQTELGVKTRGDNPGLEVKTLVARLGPAGPPPFDAPPELWVKTLSTTLVLDGRETVAVEKLRHLRMFALDGGAVRELRLDRHEQPMDEDRPTVGANLERTAVNAEGEIWSTIAVEAFGPLDRVADTLAVVLRQLPPLSARPDLTASYPAWLQTMDQ